MLCEKCKSKIATIHMTEIANGAKREVHLCEKCVEQGLLLPYFKTSFEELIKKIFSAKDDDNFLKHLDAKEALSKHSQQKASARPIRPRRAAFTCPLCESEHSNLTASTRFGCPNDYTAAKWILESFLKKHNNGSAIHSGKLPSRSLEQTRRTNAQQLLNFKIKNAIETENYELAASIRDQLKEL